MFDPHPHQYRKTTKHICNTCGGVTKLEVKRGLEANSYYNIMMALVALSLLLFLEVVNLSHWH